VPPAIAAIATAASLDPHHASASRPALMALLPNIAGLVLAFGRGLAGRRSW